MTPETALPSSLLAEIQRDWAVQDYGRALTRMEAHWHAEPKNAVRRLYYATMLGHCSRFEAARPVLDSIVADATPDTRLWALGSAGWASNDFRRFDWAAEYLGRAATCLDPPVTVFRAWVESLERLNRLDDAGVALAEGRGRFPYDFGLILLAARLARRAGAIEGAERSAREVIDAPFATPDQRCEAGYELGHALDAQDRCPEALAAFLAAKQIQRPRAETYGTMWRARVERLRTGADDPSAEDFRRWAGTPPAPSRRHAFLVGCPRSGTTLLERMLGSHPDVASSSESTIWMSAVWVPFLRDCESKGINGMRGALDAASADQLQQGRANYWQGIGQTTNGEPGNRMLLDKNPSAFSVLPGVVRFFPDAHVLVALRDPRDVVWSCFTQYLPVNPATAAFVSLDTTAEQTAAELQQWSRLRERFVTPWLEVRYENLVENPAQELRAVLDFLGLPWSDRLLRFHERPEMVGSPTYAGASRPVHREAVGRWQRYEESFRPFEARLEHIDMRLRAA